MESLPAIVKNVPSYAKCLANLRAMHVLGSNICTSLRIQLEVS